MMLTSPRGTGSCTIRLAVTESRVMKKSSEFINYLYLPDILFFQEYHKGNVSDVYSQVVFNRTADEVTKFEVLNGRSSFSPAWILKITWENAMPVSYQKMNVSEV